MQSKRKPIWWSWADIVTHAGQLGIPNFQRGAVWGMANKTALLESMYEQSPCGSFVLWTPEGDPDPLRQGVPLLREFEQGVLPSWLVDGQQRTRAMLDTFEQLLMTPTGADGWKLVRGAELESLRELGGISLPVVIDDADESAKEDDYESAFWGVVLPAMQEFDRGKDSYFGRNSESRQVLRGSTFRRLAPTARIRIDSQGKEKAAPPRVLGVVPLATLIASAGVFHDTGSRLAAELALGTFWTDRPDFQSLDELLPWGPQFVTGHAYERLEQGVPTPMRWADLHRRAEVAEGTFMIERLAGLFAPTWRPVLQQFEAMFRDGRFAVGWLPPSDVSAAIDAYVRINRAGIRVRSEEHALALLSRAHPKLLDELAHFVHLRDADELEADSRSLLVHESERQMGFTVWMRAVTRYSALALLGTVASNWLGTSAIEKDTFGYRLSRIGPTETPAGRKTWARADYATPGELVQECSARATRALVLIDAVLSEELLLDHRMARSSTWALTPLVDLFYRLPESALGQLEQDGAFRAAIARLLHWALLSPYLDQADLRHLIAAIHDVPEVYSERPIPIWGADGLEWEEQLRRALGRYQESMLDLWRGKRAGQADHYDPESLPFGDLPRSEALNELAVRAFEADVREARSLQHPAIGWLYAIERRGGAREFLWQAQFNGYKESGGKVGTPQLPGLHGCEAELRGADGEDARALYPEKQHIVPFAVARQIVGKGGTRATSSPANAIGNLTWLTQRQNGLKALADRWTVMDQERDGENLRARGMLGPVSGAEGSRTALAFYEELRDAVLDDSWRERQPEVQEVFDAFCEARGDWMVEQMRVWLEEPLSDEAEWWLGGRSAAD